MEPHICLAFEFIFSISSAYQMWALLFLNVTLLLGREAIRRNNVGNVNKQAILSMPSEGSNTKVPMRSNSSGWKLHLTMVFLNILVGELT